VLDLRGGIIADISPKVQVGGSKLDAPYAFGTFGATSADRAIIFVVQATPEYADTLPSIVSTLDQEVLGSLGEHTQVAILQYGDSTGSGKLGTVKTARASSRRSRRMQAPAIRRCSTRSIGRSRCCAARSRRSKARRCAR